MSRKDVPKIIREILENEDVGDFYTALARRLFNNYEELTPEEQARRRQGARRLVFRTLYGGSSTD